MGCLRVPVQRMRRRGLGFRVGDMLKVVVVLAREGVAKGG
jgi:hypothetical protein